DVATRAARLFDEVVIAVYRTPAKNMLFTPEERMELIREATADLPNVTVDLFSGLLVEYVQSVGSAIIVKGLRTSMDFEMELQQAFMNQMLAPGVEVVCLMTSLRYGFLSSSLLKEVAGLGGSLDGIVPSNVAAALSRKLVNRDR
ncbi:pantetheine-phosphate adenylyltransferase, partial [Metallibacterium sp.]